MKSKSLWFILFSLSLGTILLFLAGPDFSSLGWAENKPAIKSGGFTGSGSCRECHEKFYQLWAPSHHGLAMQPYTAAFARKALSPQKAAIKIGPFRYRVDLGPDRGLVREKGPTGSKAYPMVYALGGKNVYYFLTPLKKGRLQTLPVAYDVNKKEWFDTAASGIRHFPGQGRDAGLHWKEWPYTFNTACHSCHVSQFSSNYDLKTDTYKTTWVEPGINCETCHGPAGQHIEVCRQAPKGTIPRDLKIIQGGSKFPVTLNNEACASCHAKSIPLTTTFKVGDRFFDYFDLVTLENPDYYPDGRDLGENYTYTSWLLSPCVRSGQLGCLHCHTSSGRFRQKEDPNQACNPCHAERVNQAAVHTRHPPGSAGNRCIACHMPMTGFARMNRSDHSMRPPTPSVTRAFKSPNACNGCHKDKDADWADQKVRQWHEKDYQAPILHRAGLIEAARKGDRNRLPEILEYLRSPDRQPVFAASLIRLLMSFPDNQMMPVYLGALKDPSPLVRSAAAQALGLHPGPQAVEALFKALGDEYRLVRIKAAEALADYPRDKIPASMARVLDRAVQEYIEVIMARPDLWTSHYNLGNYYLNRGDLKAALASYRVALKMEPRSVLSDVNASLAYARSGKPKKAEESLKRALKTAPDNGAAHFNLGLLKAEQNDFAGAEQHLRRALKADPQMDQAAYNLCLVLARDRLGEAIPFCHQASGLRPENPKYAYTLAFYLYKQGRIDEAVGVLKTLRQKYPGYEEAALLLKEISNNGGLGPDQKKP